MSELAKQLIEENLRTQNPYLDLGNCGLDGTEACLEQLKECVHLRELSFENKRQPDRIDDENNLLQIPACLPHNIKRLNLRYKRFLMHSTDIGITDLTPIKHLKTLTSLCIDRNQVGTLKELKSLFNLEVLSLKQTGLTSLAGIEYLTNLIYLDVSSNVLESIPEVGCLHKLTYLDLSGTDIPNLRDIEGLQELTKLKVVRGRLTSLLGISGLQKLTHLDVNRNFLKSLLDLNKCIQLEEVNAVENPLMNITIENLLKLTTLNIGAQLADPTYTRKKMPLNTEPKLLSLKNLPQLRLLMAQELGFTEVQLQNVPQLSGLHLQGNELTELSFLAHASELTRLSLGENLITDIAVLETLPLLESLYASGNYIQNISVLETLPKITELLLTLNEIRVFPKNMIQKLDQLEGLYIHGNPVENIPSELFNIYDDKDYPQDCLPALRTYFSDLAQGKTKVHQSKVILIGNGRTGKTSLVKRWLDNTFDASEASTHAIQLRAHFMPALEQAKELDRAQVNIWDFGGQDIYHSTHLLFMQTQAVFVLVWDAETEAQATQEETLADGSVVTYQNQPLTYWLDYAHNLGNRSPILVVQTKKEQHGEQLPDNWNALKTHYDIVAHVSVDSAQADAYKNGFKSLQLELEKVIYAQIEKSCTDLPSSWWQVRQQIAELQGSQQKTLSQEAFLQICEQAQLNESSQNTLRNYLHDTGFFFYSSVLFDGKIIIDQQWAIEAVYTLLDRQGMFMKYRGKGFFHGEDLSLVWSTRPLTEQELLVSFMESCEMCVEVSHYWGKLASGFVPFEKREYLAPQLLPDEPIPNQADIFPEGAKGVYLKLAHPFLHAGVMQHLIVLYASKASRENIKKNCIYLHYGQQKVLVQASLANHEIVVRLANPDNHEALNDFDEVLEAIRFDLLAIGQHLIGVREMISVDGSGYIIWNALRNHSPQNPKIRAENEQEYDFAEFKVFLSRGRRSVNHPPSQNNDVASSVPSELEQAVEQALEFVNQADFAQYFEVLRIDLIPEEHLATYNRLKKMLIIEGVKVDYDEQLKLFAKSLL